MQNIILETIYKYSYQKKKKKLNKILLDPTFVKQVKCQSHKANKNFQQKHVYSLSFDEKNEIDAATKLIKLRKAVVLNVIYSPNT